ncbi:MAG TPA: hypothetical protein VNT75_14800 [Symbiobacteriaceae bacterium]|nr:hypothetical protein [Symbiobacteriaceae bacterium]
MPGSACGAADFEVTRYTLEGDPVILKLSVGPKIQASVDTRQDRFSAEADRKVTLYTCTSLKRITDPEPAFRLEGRARVRLHFLYAPPGDHPKTAANQRNAR